MAGPGQTRPRRVRQLCCRDLVAGVRSVGQLRGYDWPGQASVFSDGSRSLSPVLRSACPGRQAPLSIRGAYRKPRNPSMATTMTTAPTSQIILFIFSLQALSHCRSSKYFLAAMCCFKATEPRTLSSVIGHTDGLGSDGSLSAGNGRASP